MTLNKQINLQAYTPNGRDGMGQPIKTWIDHATVWADVRFISGREFVRADKETSEATGSIRIRARTVTTAMRVRFRGSTYDIKAILPVSGGEFIDLAVTEAKE